MFVAEKAGKVRVVTAAGTLVSKPLIDISDHVNTTGDRGLLGLAVDSSFAVEPLPVPALHDTTPILRHRTSPSPRA